MDSNCDEWPKTSSVNFENKFLTYFIRYSLFQFSERIMCYILEGNKIAVSVVWIEAKINQNTFYYLAWQWWAPYTKYRYEKTKITFTAVLVMYWYYYITNYRKLSSFKQLMVYYLMVSVSQELRHYITGFRDLGFYQAAVQVWAGSATSSEAHSGDRPIHYLVACRTEAALSS